MIAKSAKTIRKGMAPIHTTVHGEFTGACFGFTSFKSCTWFIALLSNCGLFCFGARQDTSPFQKMAIAFLYLFVRCELVRPISLDRSIPAPHAPFLASERKITHTRWVI
jgi:hypothetical protein